MHDVFDKGGDDGATLAGEMLEKVVNRWSQRSVNLNKKSWYAALALTMLDTGMSRSDIFDLHEPTVNCTLVTL